MNERKTAGSQPAEKPTNPFDAADYVRCDDDGITVTRPHAFTDEQWDSFKARFEVDQTFRELLHLVQGLSPAEQAGVRQLIGQLKAERPSGPIQCAPWCTAGDGHPDERHVDDQWCISETYQVRFTGTAERQGTVHLQQHPGEPAAVVLEVELEDGDEWIAMTVGQARSTEAALDGLAELADSGGPSR